MKKRVGVILLAAVLVADGLGGFAYATNGHEPMTGQKLVGQGVCIEYTFLDQTVVNHLDTGFFLTNPDCVSEITIDDISVFAYDGTVLYEGPLRVKVNDEWEVYTGPLKPHQTLQTSLSYYDLPEITHEVEMWYTV